MKLTSMISTMIHTQTILKLKDELNFSTILGAAVRHRQGWYKHSNQVRRNSLANLALTKYCRFVKVMLRRKAPIAFYRNLRVMLTCFNALRKKVKDIQLLARTKSKSIQSLDIQCSRRLSHQKQAQRQQHCKRNSKRRRLSRFRRLVTRFHLNFYRQLEVLTEVVVTCN